MKDSTSLYFLFDTETGGIEPKKNSILTLYGIVLDDNFNELDNIDLKLKPDNEVYHVTSDALDRNKIDLIEHNKTAITYSQASRVLSDFFTNYTIFGKKFIATGHNVSFDVNFTKEHLIKEHEWRRFFRKNTLDTKSIAHFLYLCGLSDVDLGQLPLKLLAEHQGIKHNECHVAKNDVYATLKVLKSFTRKYDFNPKRSK